MITLELSDDQALVLFDWVVRLNQGDPVSRHQAERRVLWDLESMLDKRLVGPLSQDYCVLVEEARRRVQDPEDA